MPVATTQDAAAAQADEDLVEELLDQLIPPTAKLHKRFLWGVSIVVVAIVVSFLLLSGRVYPNPTQGTSWSSGGPIAVDADEGTITVTVDVPNNSSRPVRITNVAFDGPGVTLVGSGVVLEPPLSASSGTEIVVNADRNDWLGEPSSSLPVTIEPGGWANLFLRVRPEDCTAIVEPAGDWGVASVTMDFGDGAFPPTSRTIRLESDPVVDDGESVTFVEFVGPDGFEPNFFEADAGVVATACEALR